MNDFPIKYASSDAILDNSKKREVILKCSRGKRSRLYKTFDKDYTVLTNALNVIAKLAVYLFFNVI